MTTATSHPPGAEAYFTLLLPVCVIINSQTLKFHSPVSPDPLIARLLAFPKGALHMSDRAINPRHAQLALTHTTLKNPRSAIEYILWTREQWCKLHSSSFLVSFSAILSLHSSWSWDADPGMEIQFDHCSSVSSQFSFSGTASVEWVWRAGGIAVARRCFGALDTIRDGSFTCARKQTRVSLIYRTEPTTKKWKNRKTTK